MFDRRSYSIPPLARRVLPWLGLAAACLMAWQVRFIQDDAFISFRYAEHLANGMGLVWNPGEPVEGYTNFLWVVLLSLPLALGGDPIFYSAAFGVACWAVALVAAHRTASLLLSPTQAFISTSMLALNYSFMAYATGGLETPLQTSLFAVVTYLVADASHRGRWRSSSLVMLSVSAGLAFLTRMDSALLLAPFMLAAVWLAWTTTPPDKRAGQLAVGIVPAALLVAGWLVWKLSYYGDVLPNTFYVKMTTSSSLREGLIYLYDFVTYYGLQVFVLMLIPAAWGLIRGRLALPPLLWVAVTTLAVWLAYVVKVGGDFMEFRFLVPVLPLAFMAITWLIVHIGRHRAVQACLVAMVMVNSLIHHSHFAPVRLIGSTDTVKTLRSVVTGPVTWIEIGETLGNALSGASSPLIALNPAGAIPYYSKLDTIDMLGLNDRWVARHGDFFTRRVGHQRIAPLHYLKERGVNLVIGHPRIENHNCGVFTRFTRADLDLLSIRMHQPTDLPPSARMVSIPIKGTYRLLALYLKPHPTIEQAIQRDGWRTMAIEAR
jgi:arabinofuranosyltransferase